MKIKKKQRAKITKNTKVDRKLDSQKVFNRPFKCLGRFFKRVFKVFKAFKC